MSSTNGSLDHLFQALEEAGWGVILASVFTDAEAVPLHIRTAIKELGDRLFDIQEYESNVECAGLLEGAVA